MIFLLEMLSSDEERNQFAKIYENNYLKMYYIALGITKNQMEAENAVHDSFLSIAEKFEQYSHISCSEMTGLCVTIVKHKSIDIIRKRKHFSEEEIEDLVIWDERVEASPEKMAELGENEKLVHHILQKLPEVLKETLTLKYYYEFSNREISKILGIPIKTVEMRLYRGKIKMREIIDEGKK